MSTSLSELSWTNSKRIFNKKSLRKSRRYKNTKATLWHSTKLSWADSTSGRWPLKKESSRWAASTKESACCQWFGLNFNFDQYSPGLMPLAGAFRLRSNNFSTSTLLTLFMNCWVSFLGFASKSVAWYYYRVGELGLVRALERARLMAGGRPKEGPRPFLGAALEVFLLSLTSSSAMSWSARSISSCSESSPGFLDGALAIGTSFTAFPLLAAGIESARSKIEAGLLDFRSTSAG